jgi:serine/threonine protein phosphatase PrpC
MEIGISQRPARNEKVCGDCHSILVKEDTLVIIADGLGHGPMANEASVAFCEYVEKHPDGSLEEMIRGASDEISKTRGVAGALMRIDGSERRMSFAGVGNIDMQAVAHNSIHPVCTPGIVGKRIRKVIEFDYEMHPGDLVAVFSDGISSRLDLKPFRHHKAQDIADEIMATHGKDHDDATCIVIRFEQKQS